MSIVLRYVIGYIYVESECADASWKDTSYGKQAAAVRFVVLSFMRAIAPSYNFLADEWCLYQSV